MLGPTNTGKTYLAIERMLGHDSGMIGFPLRLLARENYDRMVRLKGAGQVALITGEEKIVPATARYFVCTVESMPVDRQVDRRAPQIGHGGRDRLARRLREQAHAHVMDDISRKTAVRAKAPAQQIDQFVVMTDQRGKQGRGGGIAGHRAVMRSGKVLNCK